MIQKILLNTLLGVLQNSKTGLELNLLGETLIQQVYLKILMSLTNK